MSLRVAAAPISWGVCEVPGWGAVLDPARVLSGMRTLGLSATELGPPGWLPEDPPLLRATLAEAGVELVAGFLAVPLHAPLAEVLEVAGRSAAALAGAGADLLVLAAATGARGYDARPVLDDAGWTALLAGAEAVAAAAAEHGLTTVLHPHAGTMVETPAEIDAFVAGTTLGLCLDTGHVLVGGGDPVAVARAHAARIAHVHLKDVDAGVAARVHAGELTYTDAVGAGLYRPLGAGDVDVAAVVRALTAAGYDGWYVLEQDVQLPDATDERVAAAEADVAASLYALVAMASAGGDDGGS